MRAELAIATRPEWAARGSGARRAPRARGETPPPPTATTSTPELSTTSPAPSAPPHAEAPSEAAAPLRHSARSAPHAVATPAVDRALNEQLARSEARLAESLAASACLKPARHHRAPRKPRAPPAGVRAAPPAKEAAVATRPSPLLESLAKCQEDSDKLMSALHTTFKSRYDRGDLLLEVRTKYLLVGTCDSRFAGVARFHHDEVVYRFEHPIHRQVEMHMRYADMLAVRTAWSGMNGSRTPELCFRIRNQLGYFSREYDSSNAAHELKIGFCREADMLQLQELAMPRIHALAAA
ncbi:hypothetical protein AB1Y20_006862 [Prymnesium parvum]|uniref:Uncharacterized protein n=1 Tax=Prymnesium parvum TaxID=97485 RepID=A0AB34J1V8_PRYPA